MWLDATEGGLGASCRFSAGVFHLQSAPPSRSASLPFGGRSTQPKMDGPDCPEGSEVAIGACRISFSIAHGSGCSIQQTSAFPCIQVSSHCSPTWVSVIRFPLPTLRSGSRTRAVIVEVSAANEAGNCLLSDGAVTNGVQVNFHGTVSNRVRTQIMNLRSYLPMRTHARSTASIARVFPMSSMGLALGTRRSATAPSKTPPTSVSMPNSLLRQLVTIQLLAQLVVLLHRISWIV